jgi:hypothetical protein
MFFGGASTLEEHPRTSSRQVGSTCSSVIADDSSSSGRFSPTSGSVATGSVGAAESIATGSVGAGSVAAASFAASCIADDACLAAG